MSSISFTPGHDWQASPASSLKAEFVASTQRIFSENYAKIDNVWGEGWGVSRGWGESTEKEGGEGVHNEIDAGEGGNKGVGEGDAEVKDEEEGWHDISGEAPPPAQAAASMEAPSRSPFSALSNLAKIKKPYWLTKANTSLLYSMETVSSSFKMQFSATATAPDVLLRKNRKRVFTSFADETRAAQALRMNSACSVFGYGFPSGDGCVVEIMTLERDFSRGDIVRQDYLILCTNDEHLNGAGARDESKCDTEAWHFSIRACRA
ncbi:hypothetical protein NMY22_g4231 [Coprinellus aureogranulatus]|nr:hypothetical protein NMY22_g4231 [Coprinellus aureogranulatus]